MREETDVCVVQLRQEVTSLQDMLNEARHQAEGQVSAKEDELMRFKLDLSKHRQQVRCCSLFWELICLTFTGIRFIVGGSAGSKVSQLATVQRPISQQPYGEGERS